MTTKHSEVLNKDLEDNNYELFVYHSRSSKVDDFEENIYPEDIDLLWAGLGLCSEAGEVASVLEKAIRKNGKIGEEDYKLLYDELSDTLFWIQSLLNFIPVPILKKDVESLARYNMRKLLSRTLKKECDMEHKCDEASK